MNKDLICIQGFTQSKALKCLLRLSIVLKGHGNVKKSVSETFHRPKRTGKRQERRIREHHTERSSKRQGNESFVYLLFSGDFTWSETQIIHSSYDNAIRNWFVNK